MTAPALAKVGRLGRLGAQRRKRGGGGRGRACSQGSAFFLWILVKEAVRGQSQENRPVSSTDEGGPLAMEPRAVSRGTFRCARRYLFLEGSRVV